MSVIERCDRAVMDDARAVAESRSRDAGVEVRDDGSARAGSIERARGWMGVFLRARRRTKTLESPPRAKTRSRARRSVQPTLNARFFVSRVCFGESREMEDAAKRTVSERTRSATPGREPDSLEGMGWILELGARGTLARDASAARDAEPMTTSTCPYHPIER